LLFWITGPDLPVILMAAFEIAQNCACPVCANFVQENHHPADRFGHWQSAGFYLKTCGSSGGKGASASKP
jgi:hypothetical protein